MPAGKLETAPLCFNSKLVRLKALMAYGTMKYARRFQFQTGAIKSPLVVQGGLSGVCFNSKLVRLKGICGGFEPVVRSVVSIPNWCD